MENIKQNFKKNCFHSDAIRTKAIEWFECRFEKTAAFVDIAEGRPDTKKYHVVTVHDKEYFVKAIPRINSGISLKLCTMLQAMRNQCIRIPRLYGFEHLAQYDITILVYEYINGTKVSALLNQADLETSQFLGAKAGVLLRQIHAFRNAEYPAILKNGYQRASGFNRYLNYLHITYPYKKEMDNYIRSERHFINSNSEIALTHQDYRPDNLILRDSDNEIWAIDFESVEFNDPCSDFSYIISMAPPAHFEFSKAVIKSYLEAKETEYLSDFWRKTCFYSIVSLRKYAINKYLHTGRGVVMQANHLYELYEGFTRYCPHCFVSLGVD